MPSEREPSARPRPPGSQFVAATGERPDGCRPWRWSWTIRVSSTATPGVTFTYDRPGRKATAQVDYLVWQGDSWEPDPTAWAFAAEPANVHDSQPALALIDAMPRIPGRRGRPRARPALVLGDRAYGTPRNLAGCCARGIRPCLARIGSPHRSRLGVLRRVVESCRTWFAHCRSLTLCYNPANADSRPPFSSPCESWAEAQPRAEPFGLTDANARAGLPAVTHGRRLRCSDGPGKMCGRYARSLHPSALRHKEGVHGHAVL